jgi:hypothetical protein
MALARNDALRDPRRGARLYLVVLCFGWVLFLGLNARAAAFEVNDTDWEGTSELLSLARAALVVRRDSLPHSTGRKCVLGYLRFCINGRSGIRRSERIPQGWRSHRAPRRLRQGQWLSSKRFQIKRRSTIGRHKLHQADSHRVPAIGSWRHRAGSPSVVARCSSSSQSSDALVHPNLTPVLRSADGSLPRPWR